MSKEQDVRLPGSAAPPSRVTPAPARAHDQAAPGRPPPAGRVTGDRAGDAPPPRPASVRGPTHVVRTGTTPVVNARRRAAAAGHHRHVDRPRAARSRPAGRDGLPRCPRLGRRRPARRGPLPVGHARVAAAPGKRPHAPRRPDAGRRRPLSMPISPRPESRPRKIRPCGARCRGRAGWARAG